MRGTVEDRVVRGEEEFCEIMFIVKLAVTQPHLLQVLGGQQLKWQKDCTNLQRQKAEEMIKHTEEKHIIDKVTIHYYLVVTVTSLWLVLSNQLWPQIFTNT